MAIKKSVSKTPAKSAVTTTTPVRNSAVPPRVVAPAPAAKKLAPVHGQIALRAYEIWQSGKGGSQDDNWFRAESDLRGV